MYCSTFGGGRKEEDTASAEMPDMPTTRLTEPLPTKADQFAQYSKIPFSSIMTVLSLNRYCFDRPKLVKVELGEVQLMGSCKECRQMC